jgi:hypothetical protein
MKFHLVIKDLAKCPDANYNPCMFKHCGTTEATSLDWKISVFGKSQCSAMAC